MAKSDRAIRPDSIALGIFGGIAGLAALAAWLHAYLRTAPVKPEAPSFMIPASNLLAYVIGAIALMQPPWVAVALTIAAVLLLGTRERLHRRCV